MKTKLIQSAKVFLLIFAGFLLLIGVVAVITRLVQRPVVDIPADNEKWKQYEASILSACYSAVSLPSDKLCEWDIITQRGNTIYVWAFCADVNGQGSSGPVVINVSPTGGVEKAICPLVFDDYKMLLPGDLYEEVNNYRNRFDLNRAWSHLELRFQNPTLPPLIVVDGTPLP